MKKPDFSKQGIQRFFLFHSEKLVLAAAFGLLGWFFWMGYSSDVFREKSPNQLSSLADQADQYILSETSWEKIEELRQADDKVVERIKDGLNKLDADDYPIGPWSVRVATLEPRTDPRLFKPTDLMAYQFTAPVILSPKSSARLTDPLAEFPLASERATSGSGAEDTPAAGFGGFGPSGGRGRGGDRGSDDDDDDDDRGNRRKSGDDDMPEIAAGNQIKSIHQHTLPGVRPVHFGLNPATDKSFMMNVICVTALVDLKQQNAEYQKSFSSGVGFYPNRDRPIFQYVQPQRRVVKEGEPEGEWEDISQYVMVRQPEVYPRNLITMPNSPYPSAPEPVHPDFYDPVLTSPIPAITQFDYRPFVLHPKVDQRIFDKIPETADDSAKFSRDDIFSGNDDDDSGSGNLRGGQGGRAGGDRGGLSSGRGGMSSGPGGLSAGRGGISGGPGGLSAGRGGISGGPGGLSAGRGGISGGRGGLSGGRGGLSGGRSGGGGRGGVSSGSGPSSEEVIVRSGSDLSQYWKALASPKAKRNHKLVRFFDLQAKADVIYEYRVRLWLGDPNNEDPNNTFASIYGTVDIGTASNTGSDDEEDEEEDGNDATDDSTSQEDYEYVSIKYNMKAPEVRERLGLTRSKVDPKDSSKKDYYVTEFRKAADGTEVKEEVMVPQEHPYLRFARPTEWSETVKISVKPELAKVVAGQVELPRPIKINNESIPDGEPTLDIVASVRSKKYNAILPARRQVYRADALDFSADIHVLNPVTWLVRVMRNAPVVTETVIVDMLGGDELDLPRQELMRHHLPSEVLIMNADGTFDISNDIVDKTQFKQLLLLDDDSAEVGKKKRRPKEDDERDRGRGPGNGGRGR